MVLNMEISVADAVSIGIAFAALVFSVRQYYYEKNRNRKEATIHAFDKLEEEVFFNKEYSNHEKKIWIDSIVEVVRGNRDGENRKLAAQFPARVEHFAVGVNSKIYDLETLNRMAGNFIIDQYNKNWIHYIREKRLKDGNNNLYIEIEQMVNALKKLRSAPDMDDIDPRMGT